MGSVPAEKVGEEGVSKRQVWVVRGVVGACLGLGLLMGGVVLQSHFRERRVDEFIRRFQARGGSIERGYGSELSQWLVKLRWGLGNSLFGWPLKDPRPEVVALGRSSLSKEEIPILGDLPYLKELYLEETPLTSELCSSLGSVKSLQYLAFRKSDATDQTFAELCRALERHQGLMSLTLLEAQVTNEGIKELSWLKRVTSLAIESPHLTGEVLKLLAGRSMRYLSLRDWKLTTADVSFMVDQWSGTLEGVSIGGRELSPQAIVPLQKCRQLRSLALREVSLTPELMGNLKRVYSILDLTLEETSLEQKSLEILAALPVNSLTLTEMALPKQGMRMVGRNPKISSLTLSGVQVGDAEIADLVAGARLLAVEGKRSKLSSLGLYNTKITDRGISDLESLPELYSLSFQNCELTNAALDKMGTWDLSQRPERFFYLDLHQTKVTPEGIERLKKKQPKVVVTSFVNAEGN